MAYVTRLGDKTRGHIFPPVPSVEASDFVSEGSKGFVYVGCRYQIHCHDGSCHIPILAEGSSFVTIEGKAVGRVGDATTCGDHVAEGSSFINIEV